MDRQRLKALLCCIMVIILLSHCNKNSDQIPRSYDKIVVAAKLNGINDIDFIFEQTKNSIGDTVWLSIRNNSPSDIMSMKLVVEACNAIPQSYDNCDLQAILQIQNTLKASSTLAHVFSWADKEIKLDSELINVGILSYSGAVNLNGLNGVYNDVNIDFETNIGTPLTHSGSGRGYILADGTTTFRIKKSEVNRVVEYNVSGKFNNTGPFNNGQLFKGDSLITSLDLEGQVDRTVPEKPKFRLKLGNSFEDINYIYFKAQ